MGYFDGFSYLSPAMFSGRQTQLHEFLTNRELPLLQRSDERRSRLITADQVREYAAEMKKEFISRLGGIPERDCDLDAKTVRIDDMGGYMLESVIYRARRNVYVTASLYLPKGLSRPSAAILFLSGHSAEGRMGERYQEVCQTLANAGLIVFAIDPPGQGERKSFYDPDTGKYADIDPVSDHDRCGVPSIAAGRFIEAYFLNEQMAAVDYMLTRPEIDPGRIGVTGNSGGGLQSISMMACDDRIAAAAPGTFTSTRREILYTCQSQDSEQIWPGCAEYGFDHFEPYIIFAPKPALMLTVSSDFFPIEGAEELYSEMRRIYSLFGREDNIRIITDKACHGYTQNLADKAAEFFCEVFGVEKRPDNSYKALPVEKIRATPSGSVRHDISDSWTIPDETAALAADLRRGRNGKGVKEWLREKVMSGRQPFAANPRISEDRNSGYIGDYIGRLTMWWVEKRLSAFGIMISSVGAASSAPTVIALWDNGTKAIGLHDEWIKARCAEGKKVLVVDLPGVGNIEQAKFWYDIPYRAAYGAMYKMCCDLMYMGDSMAAMQTYHVIRTIDMLKDCMGVKDISLYCCGGEGVYGIMAGYLTGTDREYGDDLITSVEKQIIGQRPLEYDNTLAYIIPGMLEYFDYDEIM